MPRRAQPSEQGAIAVLAAVVLIAIGAFLALSLNAGHKMNARVQIQAALDSSALAGAQGLSGSNAGLSVARASAFALAGRHHVDSSPFQIDATADIAVQYWDLAGKKPYAAGATVPFGGTTVVLDPVLTPYVFNAVRVTGGADGQSGHNQALPVHFGGFVGGAQTIAVSSGSVAVGGGPCRDGCAVTLAIPACALVDAGGNILCDAQPDLELAKNNIAFTDLNNRHGISDDSIARATTRARTCGNGTLRVGAKVQLQNGGGLSSKIAQAYNAPEDDGDGAPLVCPTPGSPGDCPSHTAVVVETGQPCGTPLGNTYEVAGFVRVKILTVDDTKDVIKLQVSCGERGGTGTGCGAFGYAATYTRLVQ
jgi:Putative Flp pilus-assembly TadE/G-like